MASLTPSCVPSVVHTCVSGGKDEVAYRHPDAEGCAEGGRDRAKARHHRGRNAGGRVQDQDGEANCGQPRGEWTARVCGVRVGWAQTCFGSETKSDIRVHAHSGISPLSLGHGSSVDMSVSACVSGYEFIERNLCGCGNANVCINLVDINQ